MSLYITKDNRVYEYHTDKSTEEAIMTLLNKMNVKSSTTPEGYTVKEVPAEFKSIPWYYTETRSPVAKEVAVVQSTCSSDCKHCVIQHTCYKRIY